MKLFVITALIAACGAAKLDRTYLPPISAATAGGSSGDIQLPFERSSSQTGGIEGIPKGGTVNEFQGVVVDAAAPGTRSSDQETGLGGPRQSYGSQDSKVGEAAFKTTNSNAQASLNLQFNNGSPNRFQHSQSNGQNRPTDVQASGTQLSGQFGQTVGQPFERIQAARDRAANTVRFESEVGPENFSYSFETDNGIAAEESGVASNGVQAKGGFSYTGDDGQVYSVTYTADEGGYQPVGDHLPTPPPIPEEILKSLEQNARDEAAGLIDDGSYDAQKYNEGGDYSESDGDSGQYNRNQARPGTGNFGQSGFTNVDQSGRLTTATGNFGNTNKQVGQDFGSNFNPNSFDNKSGSQTGNVGAHAQHATGFGNRLSSHTSAFATSFASNQGTDDQITKNSQNTPVAQLIGSTQNQQLQPSAVNFDKEGQAGKDSVGAGTIQEIQTAKGTFGGSSRNQFGGITEAAYLPPTNQGTGKGSSRPQASSQQSVPQGPGYQQTFTQFSANSQQQGYSTHPFSQQNSIGNKKSSNTQQPSNLQDRTEISNSFNTVRTNFQSQGINNQPSAIQTTSPSDSSLSQTGIATSSIGNVNGPSETSKYGQSTSFNNRNSGTSPFTSSQRQTQNQNRFNSQQFPTNPQPSTLSQQSSNLFQQQTSSLNIKSDQSYNYDRPSIPFQADSGRPQQFGDSNRFPGSSSNQFNRLNQQYTDTQQVVGPDSNFNQKFPTSSLNSQSQFNAQFQGVLDKPSSITSNQQTLSSTSNSFRGYQSNVPKQNTANFNQRGSSQTSGQASFPSNFPSIGTSAQLSVQNQQSSLLQNGYRKQTPNNVQSTGTQNGFTTSTQQINQFARPESSLSQSINVGANQQQGVQGQALGEIYQYDKPAESLPMPNRDQSESSTPSGIQSSRPNSNSQIFRMQSQFSSQNVAGRGEIFDSSRKPPSYDSETGYHYR